MTEVALFVVVCLLDVLLLVGTVLVCVHGFEQRSPLEWYADRKAARRRRLYTLARPKRRVLV